MGTWLDMSKYQARRINLLTGSWDPANYDISRIDWDKLVAEAEGILIRIGDGLHLDPCFARYRDALRSRNALWGIYHLHRPSILAGQQVAFCLLNQAECPPAGVWGDLEVAEGKAGEGYFALADAYLRGLDQAFATGAGMYSARWFLNSVLSDTQQRRWVGRKVWWASYAGLLIPAGWSEADPVYHLHQFTDAWSWAGLPRPADASRRNPAVPLADLLPGRLPPPLDEDILLKESIAVLADRIRVLSGD